MLKFTIELVTTNSKTVMNDDVSEYIIHPAGLLEKINVLENKYNIAFNDDERSTILSLATELNSKVNYFHEPFKAIKINKIESSSVN